MRHTHGVTIYNGPHTSAPIASLCRPDGSIIDIYQPGDVFAAFLDAVGLPPAPSPLHAGMFVVAEPLIVYLADGEPLAVPQMNFVPADGFDAATANEYAAKVAAYNARAQAIASTLTSLWPSIVAQASSTH
jgi:hypothetical protein